MPRRNNEASTLPLHGMCRVFWGAAYSDGIPQVQLCSATHLSMSRKRIVVSLADDPSSRTLTQGGWQVNISRKAAQRGLLIARAFD